MIDDRVGHEGPVRVGGGEVEVGLEPGEVYGFISRLDAKEADATSFFWGIQFVDADCGRGC